ncbi:Sodium-coupled neutral amino acid transporter 3 N-system amino acid transporter 1 [Triplophysa tibetana]|uniref:Sodium-coupled neutral amino acid transporter 3 N-system amino acid transporter 1 n=1 Tax=Triplophysa tibetana TaxID=1572043 RepID=A0A5A9NWU0_9TELE|nr:Sodium-coupled neutral amino acid transporter 3 N-system amino acid transporter 1 [Triplophysa tibetana]
MSVFNLSNAIMGSGILGLSYAMSNTGIVLFLILLTSIAVLSSYSVHLLLKCAGVVGMADNVIYKKFNIPCPYDGFTNHTAVNISTDDECEAKYFTINQQTAYTVPILAFAFVCHPEVLPIYTELRNPTKRRMQAIANVSILGMFVMYLLTAIFGYLTFYLNTEAELLHTYSKVDPLDILILCVRLAVLVAVTLTVPVVLFPIRRAILQLLFPDKPFHWVRHVLIALCLLFVVNLLVIFVPNIRDIFGIIGATSAPSLIFILPGLFYIRIVSTEQEPMNSKPKIQAACFTALGFIFMSMSLTFIVLDWIYGENRSGGGH